MFAGARVGECMYLCPCDHMCVIVRVCGNGSDGYVCAWCVCVCVHLCVNFVGWRWLCMCVFACVYMLVGVCVFFG